MNKELRLVITKSCNYNCYFCHEETVDNNCKSLFDSNSYLFLVKRCKMIFG